MTEPTTTNLGLIIPNTGDIVGTWGSAAINPNMSTIDSLETATTTKSLTNANITLSLTEQNVSRILVTGTLTGNCDLLFSRPGEWVLDNQCVVGAFYVRLSKADGTGNKIGAPPGRKCRAYFDGTGFDYVDIPPVGSALDLHGVTALPAWMTACTVAPYLIKDGSTPLIATYPQLAALLGTTFGGNGINTFGLPDERNRARIAVDTNPGSGFSNRITAGVSGINGQSMGAAGGDQNYQQHTHAVTDPQHSHGLSFAGLTFFQTSGTGNAEAAAGGGSSTNAAATNITINNAGTGVSGNVQPSIISFLPLIKT